MKQILMGLCLAALLATNAFAVTPGDTVVKKIVENGHKRIGVLPAVIIRDGDRENTIGTLGPRGKLMAEEIYKKLVSASRQGAYKGQFRVIPERTMRRAMKLTNFDVDDLGDPDKLAELSDEAGVDTLVTLTKDEDKDELLATVTGGDFSDLEENEEDGEQISIDHINAEIVDSEDGFTTFTQDFEDERTLAKAAYMGESWELRRWEDGKLKNLGIDLEGKLPFGKGVRWEKYHYASLRDELVHPIDIADFPYQIKVLVDGKWRKPEAFDGDNGRKYVVALNPGEVYEVGLVNDGDEPVYVALYIDGVNSVDKVRMEPEDLETKRHWYLEANIEGTVRGWYEIERDDDGKPGTTQYYNEFKIVPRDESVAFGKGFEENIGMITAVYYTVGMDNVEAPDDSDLPPRSRGLPKAQFGTGLGDRKDKQLDFASKGPRGVILGAVTLYYRTEDQIEEMREGESIDPVIARRDKEGSKSSGGGDAGGSEQQASETDLPS